MADVAFVVHGHFYQPPRENPWTEEVPGRASAAPFHDWNERITAECYRPNGWARVLDDHGRIVAIVDNYERLSASTSGPTLLSWLERPPPRRATSAWSPPTGAAGGAIAQAYNHLILPLANERDIRTQVRWGSPTSPTASAGPPRACGCPRRRSTTPCSPCWSRRACGVHDPGPHPGGRRPPARRARPGTDVSDGRSRRRAAPLVAPPGRGGVVDLVFYDGDLSHDLAFGLSGLSSQALVARVARTGADGTPGVVATDGETFGHHHHYADRASPTPSTVEAPTGVEVAPGRAGPRWPSTRPCTRCGSPASSWSCAHGVERWRGLRLRHRRRAGLEPGVAGAAAGQALDVLRDAAVEVFERRGRRCCTTRGPPATPTSTCCWAPRRSTTSPPPRGRRRGRRSWSRR